MPRHYNWRRSSVTRVQMDVVVLSFYLTIYVLCTVYGYVGVMAKNVVSMTEKGSGSLIGHVNEFKLKENDFNGWVERFEL